MVCWGIFQHTPRLRKQCDGCVHVGCLGFSQLPVGGTGLCCCVLLARTVGSPVPGSEFILSGPIAAALAARRVQLQFSLQCRCLFCSVASSLSLVSRLQFSACKTTSNSVVCALCEVPTPFTVHNCLNRPPYPRLAQSFTTSPAKVACGGRAAMLLT